MLDRCGPKSLHGRRAPQERSVAEKAARDSNVACESLKVFTCCSYGNPGSLITPPLSNEPNTRRFEPLPVSAVPATLVAEPVTSHEVTWLLDSHDHKVGTSTAIAERHLRPLLEANDTLQALPDLVTRLHTTP